MVLMVFFEAVVYAFSGSLTRSCHVVLSQYVTFRMNIDAHEGRFRLEPRLRGIVLHFELPTFFHNCANSCCFCTKLLAYFFGSPSQPSFILFLLFYLISASTVPFNSLINLAVMILFNACQVFVVGFLHYTSFSCRNFA